MYPCRMTDQSLQGRHLLHLAPTDATNGHVERKYLQNKTECISRHDSIQACHVKGEHSHFFAFLNSQPSTQKHFFSRIKISMVENGPVGG